MSDVIKWCGKCFCVANFNGKQPPFIRLIPWTSSQQNLQVSCDCAVKTPTDCANGRPAVLWTLSSESSGSAPPPQSCWGPEKSSQSSPYASCCAYCRRTGWASRPTAGKERPGRQTSLWRWGWAVLGRWTSYTWTSRGPWSSVTSAWRMYLCEQSTVREPTRGVIANKPMTSRSLHVESSVQNAHVGPVKS